MLRPFPSSMRAAANTPAEPVGACVAHFPTGSSLPRYQGGSASASYPFEACSAFTRVAARIGVLQTMSLPPSSAPTATGWNDSCRAGFAPAEEWRLPRRTSECFRRCRYLHHPLRLLPAGTTVAGRDSHPLKNGAFHGAPDKGDYVAFGHAGKVRKLVCFRQLESVTVGWLGVVISAIAAWLLWDNGWLWLVGAIGVGGIELWSWGIMHNFATEVAKYRRSYTGGFYDFTRHEVDAIPDWIATLNLVGFVAAIGLLIVGFVI